MFTLTIPDMSCGHCKASVEAAIVKIDPEASVVVDLAGRTARVTSTEPAEALIEALRKVGFPATVA
jgi:copper chaperone